MLLTLLLVSELLRKLLEVGNIYIIISRQQRYLVEKVKEVVLVIRSTTTFLLYTDAGQEVYVDTLKEPLAQFRAAIDIKVILNIVEAGEVVSRVEGFYNLRGKGGVANLKQRQVLLN